MLPASRLSFYTLDSPAIREQETVVARLSGELASCLPLPTRSALAQCLEGINSYYSNLIEGQSTRPVEAEHALQRGLSEPSQTRASDLALLAVAHIQTERWMRRCLRDTPDLDPTQPDFLCELHHRFVSQLPESMRRVEGDGAKIALNKPGVLRARAVRVGAHVAPAPEDLPALLEAFSQGWQQLPKTPAHVLLAHHRITWVHPFLDGNGRVARLLTTAMLARQQLDAGGLWSLSRGLAKRRAAYYEHLALADSKRENDYDGRGLLSRAAAERFALFMLDVCKDQIRFMTERLNIQQVEDRMARFCAERKLVLGRDERAAPLLVEAMFMGRLERGAASRMLGLGERAARSIVAECVADGLLTATSSRADLTLNFPVYAVAYLFPHLFEIDDPQAAMRESLRIQ